MHIDLLKRVKTVDSVFYQFPELFLKICFEIFAEIGSIIYLDRLRRFQACVKHNFYPTYCSFQNLCFSDI